MYSVLVADDNSNIQKMVSLALKDEGIDVVAVGNGEAAVRHLKDSLPDLILADIFMPARNGYEVCEFVKRDERLQHIPVILLVGAFDPLDDEEVRRVRADGVLKKPFVPPEPLIALVKSTLERVPPRKPAPEAAAPPPESSPAPPGPLAELPVPPPEEPEEQLYRAPAFSMAEESPLAFGTLLESPPEPPEPPATRDGRAMIGARGIPDDDVAAAQLESTGYFAMDAPSLAPAEPPTGEAALQESPEPPSPLPGPFAESAWTPAPPAEEPRRAEEPAAPAEAAPPALEWPVAEEGSWPPPPAHAPAAARDESELPGSIELLEPVMRSVPPAPPPAAETFAPPQSEPPREERCAAPAQPDPAVVEAIVEKVVERLRPQLDEVARDILRPVAEAMLQRELDKVSDRSRN